MSDPIKISFMLVAFGIIYIGNGTPASFGTALVFYFIVNAAWNAAGGWPEAWYRVRHIDYRQFYVIAPNRRILRPLVRESDLKVGGSARAEIQITKEKTAEYGVPTSADEMFNNPHGAPASLHNWDDYRPIPVFGREPNALTADGTSIPKAKIDPMLIHAAYKNDVLERRHRLNIKTSNLKWGIFGFMIVIAVILSFAAVYYSIYYGLNNACALHSKACP